MKNITFLILALLFYVGAIAQTQPDRSVRINVVKEVHVSAAVRDQYVVPVGETWYLTLTDGSKWKNIGGVGWVSDAVGSTTSIANGTNTTVTGDGSVGIPYQIGVNLIDDDTFATATSTNIASAESTKAYVDASSTGGGIVAEGIITTVSGTGLYTVTHGLGYVPGETRIQVQELNTPDGFGNQSPSVKNITSTTFDIKATVSTGFEYTWRIYGTGLLVGQVDTDDQTASEVPITDVEGLTTTTNVEGYLAENRGLISNNIGDISGLDASKLDVFSTSAQLATVLTDETGSGGGFVRATSPTVSSLNASNYIRMSNPAGFWDLGRLPYVLPTGYTTGDFFLGYEDGAGSGWEKYFLFTQLGELDVNGKSIRNNLGTLQFENASDVWTDFGGGSATDSGQGYSLLEYTTTDANIEYTNSNVTASGSATGKRIFNRHANDTVGISSVSMQMTPFRIQSTKDSVVINRSSDMYFITPDSLIKSSDYLVIKGHNAAYPMYLKDSSGIKLYQMDIADYTVGNYPPSFPPAGTVIIDGDFPDATNWVLSNGSSIVPGVMTVVGAGNINVTGSNWVARQNSVFAIDGTTTYTVTFEARQTVGTGNLQVGRGFTTDFNQAVTGSFVQYSYTFLAGTQSWEDDIVFGSLASNQFEIRLFSAVVN